MNIQKSTRLMQKALLGLLTLMPLIAAGCARQAQTPMATETPAQMQQGIQQHVQSYEAYARTHPNPNPNRQGGQWMVLSFRRIKFVAALVSLLISITILTGCGQNSQAIAPVSSPSPASPPVIPVSPANGKSALEQNRAVLKAQGAYWRAHGQGQNEHYPAPKKKADTSKLGE
jgi:hypothetical protein